MTIGEFLQGLREKRGWSIREAAKQAGVSYSRWKELEKGVIRRSSLPTMPSVDLLMRVSTAFDLPLPTLLELAGHAKPSPDATQEAAAVGILRQLSPSARSLALSMLRAMQVHEFAADGAKPPPYGSRRFGASNEAQDDD